MTSISEFDTILAEMTFAAKGKYIYYYSTTGLPAEITPFVQIFEEEETVSIIPLEQAKAAGLAQGKNIYARITLTTPATLESTGMTAAICAQLNAQSIPANIVTSIHHDHLMVPVARCQETLELLDQLAKQAQAWSQS